MGKIINFFKRSPRFWDNYVKGSMFFLSITIPIDLLYSGIVSVQEAAILATAMLSSAALLIFIIFREERGTGNNS